MKALRWYGLLVAGKAYALHLIGIPAEVAVPLSGASTGVLCAYIEDKRRVERKKW